MNREAAAFYRCPAKGSPLELKSGRTLGNQIVDGMLASPDGRIYPVREGIPDFIASDRLAAEDAQALREYENSAGTYDQQLPFAFAIFGESEDGVRNRMIDRLQLDPASKVLEFGCGTGRDSALIARRLGSAGRLYLQDISPAMLAQCVARLEGAKVPVEFAVANGAWLPFPDRSFDAVYHFGGVNTFADIGRCMREAVRVSKVGGRVVIGDESMAPWLRETEFGRLLMHSNPMYRHQVPLEWLPAEARDVSVHWLLGGAFYQIDFIVGEGHPGANLDLPIPGRRGGTLRTRYYGQLEGVSAEAKQLAQEARDQTGLSMQQWLDGAVRAAALKVLNRKPDVP